MSYFLRKRAAPPAPAPDPAPAPANAGAPRYIIRVHNHEIVEENGETAQYGAFMVKKEFEVIDNETGLPANGGFIIQRVTKRPRVTVTRRTGPDTLTPERTLTTSREIAELTHDQVKFMSDDYFEIFEIDAEGKSVFADSFQNGAIVDYESIRKKQRGKTVIIWNPITDDDFSTNELFSKGTITQVGASVYFPADDPAYAVIKDRYEWVIDETKPANGLESLDYDNDANRDIFAVPKSNILEHTVTVTWGYPTVGEGGHTHESVINSEFVEDIAPPANLIGGVRRKHRITRRAHRLRRTRRRRQH